MRIALSDDDIRKLNEVCYAYGFSPERLIQGYIADAYFKLIWQRAKNGAKENRAEAVTLPLFPSVVP